MSNSPRLLVLALVSALLCLTACQAPAGQPVRPWKLKSIHAPVTDCGHYPDAQAPAPAELELERASS